MKKDQGFTLIELLVVISMIGILSSVVLVSVQEARKKAYRERERLEIKQIATAIEMYASDNQDKYPCDVSRDLPPGLEKYLSSNPSWPKAVWPGSVYDWDFWSNNPLDAGCAGGLSYDPRTEPVYQLSIRFCDADGNCKYPYESWVSGFDRYSSAYWCFSGPCRSHGSYPYDHPGCCIGGNCPGDQPKCGF